MAVQTEARPSSVETGVGTGSWGGTCDAEASAVVDSREQGTCTYTATVAGAYTQTGDLHFPSIESAVDFLRWNLNECCGLDVDLDWPPPSNRISTWLECPWREPWWKHDLPRSSLSQGRR